MPREHVSTLAKGTYTTYGEQFNAVGKISYDAPTGNTCSIVGLIPKIEQNVLFPLPVPKIIVCVCGRGDVGHGNTISFSLVPKPLGRHSVLFIQMPMSGAITEMLSTPQPDQSFRRTHEL